MLHAVPKPVLHYVMLFQSHKGKYWLTFILNKALNTHFHFKKRKMYVKRLKEIKLFKESRFLKDRSLKILNFKCLINQDLRSGK